MSETSSTSASIRALAGITAPVSRSISSPAMPQRIARQKFSSISRWGCAGSGRPSSYARA